LAWQTETTVGLKKFICNRFPSVAIMGPPGIDV